jgi:hypothetical protein
MRSLYLCAVLVFCCLASVSTVTAATVSFEEGTSNALGIDGYIFRDVTYNVSFIYATPEEAAVFSNPFANKRSDRVAARGELAAILDLAGVTSVGPVSLDRYYISDRASAEWGDLIVYNSINGEWEFEIFGPLPTTSNTIAVFTAVPIPATVWLFGSALAGLGWLRRKQAA